MSKLTVAQQKAKVAATIKVNGNKEITPPKDKILRDDQLDSSPNWKDGGFGFEAEVGYQTLIELTDLRSFVHKKYVDDATNDSLKVDGSNKMLADLDVNDFALRNVATITDTVNIQSVNVANRTGHDSSNVPIFGWSNVGDGFEIHNASGLVTYLKGLATANRTVTFQDKSYVVPSFDDIDDAVSDALSSVFKFAGTFTPDGSGDYPQTGGTGPGGAIKSGDVFQVSGLTPGTTETVGTQEVENGDTLTAKEDNPSATDDNDWSVVNKNIGYTPLDRDGGVVNNANQDWGKYGIDNIDHFNNEWGTGGDNVSLGENFIEIDVKDSASDYRSVLNINTDGTNSPGFNYYAKNNLGSNLHELSFNEEGLSFDVTGGTSGRAVQRNDNVVDNYNVLWPAKAAGSDQVPVFQSDLVPLKSKKIVTNPSVITTTNPVIISDWDYTLSPGDYLITGKIRINTPTNGSRMGIIVPAGASLDVTSYGFTTATTVFNTSLINASASTSNSSNLSISYGNVTGGAMTPWVEFNGTLKIVNAGVVSICVGSTTGGQSTQVQAIGSWLKIEPLI